MSEFHRRSVLAAGVTLASGAALGSIGSSSATTVASTDQSAQWSSFRGNAGNTGFVSVDGGFTEPDTVAWTYDETGGIAVADGTVYVATDDGTVHALDEGDGTLEWASDDVGSDGTPAVVDDIVYTGGTQVTALDASDGSIRWEVEFDTDEAIPSPTVALETVYVVAGSSLYALDGADGSTRWSRDAVTVDPADESDETVDSIPFEAGPVAVTDETVYALTDVSNTTAAVPAVVAIDATTGDSLWDVRADGVVRPPTVVTGNRIYLGPGYDRGDTPVIDPETGEQRHHAFHHRLIAATDDVRISVTDLAVSGYVHDSGDSWTSDSSKAYLWGDPIIAGETVIVTLDLDGSSHRDPAIIGFDIEDGSETWSFPLEDDMDGLAAVRGNTLYVTGDELVAVRPAGDGEGEDDDGKGDDDGQEDDDQDEDGQDDDEKGDDQDEDSRDDDQDEDETGLELSVDAPDSIRSDERAPVDISLTNHESEAVSATVHLEIADISWSTDLDLDPGVSGSGTYTVGRDGLGVGDHDWIVTANDEEESGTLTVVDESDTDDGDDRDGVDDENEATDDDESDETNGDEDPGDEADTDGEDQDSESNDDGDDGDENSDEDDEELTTEDDSSAAVEDSEESEDSEDAEGSEDDGTPGFTGTAGVAGGAITLEWLRRRALGDETDQDS